MLKKKNPKYPKIGNEILYIYRIRPWGQWKSCCKGIFNDGGMFIDVSKIETISLISTLLK